jgi:type IV pilus assembly protein PilY1
MFISQARHIFRLFLPALVALLSCGQSFGAATDLADNPLSSATTATVKPNIFFILDDSGSMNWKFMPDAMATREYRIGFRNNQCNLVYYNPNSRYVIPKTSVGGDVNAGAQTTFTAAYDDGFGAYKGLETRTSSDSGATWTAWSVAASCTVDTSGTSRRDCRVALLGSAGTTTDLSTNFRAFVDGTIDSNSQTDQIDTAQPAYYWKYAGATTLIPLQGDCEKSVSPNYTVNNASYSGGVATYTTSSAHNFAVGNTVSIINIRPTGYRGSYVVTAVPTTTTFRVAMTSNPGGYTDPGTAWNATRYAAVNEYCTDNTTTTSTCAAAGKTALWQKVVVSSTSGPASVDINGDAVVNSSDQDERQNFANWYSYYSKRIYMMKSAAGRAFVGMTDSKRIGFVTINPGSPVSSQEFRPIADFDTATKEEWFNTLYSITTASSTPLRQALSRAGRYYAGKLDGINSGMYGDPVQYSCQQNFSILTTDGYWNGNPPANSCWAPPPSATRTASFPNRTPIARSGRSTPCRRDRSSTAPAPRIPGIPRPRLSRRQAACARKRRLPRNRSAMGNGSSRPASCRRRSARCNTRRTCRPGRHSCSIRATSRATPGNCSFPRGRSGRSARCSTPATS